MKRIERGTDLVFDDNEMLEPEDLAWNHAMDISASIYTRLRELGLNQKDLAARLSLSEGRVSQIIKGDPGMSLRSLAKLEAALDFALDQGFQYTSDHAYAKSQSTSISRNAIKGWNTKAMKCEIVENAFTVMTGGLQAA